MSSKTLAFVSGCNAGYYPMLREWLHSLQHTNHAEDAAICIIDAGLEPAQVQALEALGCIVIAPDWPEAVPLSKVKGKPHLKSCVCRPYIPDIFPGYATYIWMDADTWLQDPRVIDLYLEGAHRGKLAITVQADRAYLKQIRVKWLAGFPLKIRGFYYSNALKAFGGAMARRLLPYQVLNAGAFALAGDAPHWPRWQALMSEALRNGGKVFTAEQLSLGVMTYLEGYEAEILPAWTQWLCESKPAYDTKAGAFVEPFLPHEQIGIVHLSGYDAMRLDRSVTTQLPLLGGGEAEGSFRYPAFDGETLEEIPSSSPLSP